MATKGPLRPLANLVRSPNLHHAAPRRTFLNSLLPSSPLTINVSRTLPYPRAALYDLIVDVDAYSSFLPFCQHSRVTAWSTTTPGAPESDQSQLSSQHDQQQKQQAAQSRKWPIEGQLTIGFGPITQSYTSRIVCVPGTSVEALSGQGEQVAKQKDAGQNPFKRLVTKWSVADANTALGQQTTPRTSVGEGVQWTRVDLDLSMQLEDPLVQVMISKVADETATKMIDAFELRARQLFGGGGATSQ
ncbi:dehydrase and lipid transport-domain-containing protein [Coniella lustricola]|uniref:Dehydrase and lipid transport-domain-containing protein n=1 Tax=Coniella lustricola TaxID=2025994 RepID=A0A2T3A8P9_9PEZI|nr:dehydrase and lipid transport-domain-containing protein [Coniella lustricola]